MNAWATRSNLKRLQADMPVGDPFGGPAFGMKQDPVSAIVSVGSNLIGGMMQSDAASSAADAQVQAANSANQTQLQMFNQTRNDQAPWRDAGSSALGQLSELLGINGSVASLGATPADSIKKMYQAYLGRDPDASGFQNYITEYQKGTPLSQIEKEISGSKEAITAAQSGIAKGFAGVAGRQFGSLMHNFSLADFQADPGYQFRLSEGEKAINRAAAAGGRYDSGRALKDLTRFGQDTASNEYGNAYNRFNNDQSNRFNRLASLAGVGQTANNQIAAAGQNMANNVSQNQLAAGNARASGYVGSANALGGAASGIGNYYTLSKLFGGSSGGFNPYDYSAAPQWGGSYAGFNDPSNYG